MTEIPATPRADKERMATMVFEVFNIPALYIGNQCVMSLFSTGRTTGTVVDSGESQTHCAPIWEGYCLPHHLGSMPIAGADVTNYLMGKLKGEGYPFSTHADRQQVFTGVCLRLSRICPPASSVRGVKAFRASECHGLSYLAAEVLPFSVQRQCVVYGMLRSVCPRCVRRCHVFNLSRIDEFAACASAYSSP